MKLKIPPEYEATFARLMNSVPPELSKKSDFVKTTLAYLEFGGESLARHYIQISKSGFPDGSGLLKYAPIVELSTDSEETDEDLDEDREDDEDLAD